MRCDRFVGATLCRLTQGWLLVQTCAPYVLKHPFPCSLLSPSYLILLSSSSLFPFIPIMPPSLSFQLHSPPTFAPPFLSTVGGFIRPWQDYRGCFAGKGQSVVQTWTSIRCRKWWIVCLEFDTRFPGPTTCSREPLRKGPHMGTRCDMNLNMLCNDVVCRFLSICL